MSDGPFAEPTGSTSGIDADALMNEVESGESATSNREMSGSSEPTQSSEPSTPQATPAQTAAELAFNWNGKQIKAPLNDPRVTQWVSQGYDYAQRMQAFKAQQSEFEQKQRAISEIENKYKPLEEYYSKNPDRWQYINQQYEASKNGLDATDPVAAQLQSLLESKLKPIDQFIQQAQAKEIQAKQATEDQALDSDIQSIRETYKDLDWGGVDAEGKNLEYRVLEHASRIGTTSFRAAFRDFYHDQLVKLSEEKAKEGLVKERQKQTKMGLLGQSQAPKKGIMHAEDYKNKSYDDLIAEAMEEYGIGS